MNAEREKPKALFTVMKNIWKEEKQQNYLTTLVSDGKKKSLVGFIASVTSVGALLTVCRAYIYQQ